MDGSALVTIAVLVATLVLMLTRPRGLNEAWFASAGAAILVMVGILPWDSPVQAARDTADVLIFLAGMMLVTGVVERAGVVDVVSEHIARLCGERILTLYIAMFGLAAIVTATMSLDITIILMTPILFAVTRRRGVDPVPFLFACVFVANIGSLILPVSNLTNLLLVNRVDLSFASFVRVMWLPNTVALVTTLVLFLWLFRGQLREQHIPVLPDSEVLIPGVAAESWRRLVGLGLSLVIAGLLITGFLEAPIWVPAAAGAIVLTIAAAAFRRITVQNVFQDLSLSLFVFVIAMTMLVQAFTRHVLGDFVLPVPDSLPAQIATGALMAAVASNTINNVPATVIAGEVLSQIQVGPQEVMAYAALIGANIGPALTTYGSLATMLWLSIIRKRGTMVTTGSYLRVSLITVPIVLVTTSIALWISFSLWG